MKRIRLHRWGRKRLMNGLMQKLEASVESPEMLSEHLHQADALLETLVATEEHAALTSTVVKHQKAALKENEADFRRHEKQVVSTAEAKKYLKLFCIGAVLSFLALGLCLVGGAPSGPSGVFFILMLLTTGGSIFSLVEASKKSTAPRLLHWNKRLIEDDPNAPQRARDRAHRIAASNPNLGLRFILVSLEPPGSPADAQEGFLLVGLGPFELAVAHWEAPNPEPKSVSPDADVSFAASLFPKSS